MDGKRKTTDLLIHAVIQNDVHLVTELLNEGVDPNNTLDHAHVTALHHAAQHNSLEVIPLLVEAGAFLEAVTEPDGLTALEVAFLNGNDKIAQTLIAYANEVDAREH